MESITRLEKETAMINRWTTLILAILAFLVLDVEFGPKVWAQAGNAPAASVQPSPEGVTSASVVTVHGKIIEVNKAKKKVTIEGQQGRKVTLNVDNPYNLEAAKVGAPVVARFYEVVNIRKKRPGESIPSASVSQGIATARPGQVPGAVAAGQLSIVVSVTGIDTAKGTITVKGPDGAEETVKARDPRNLKKVKVGDELVVTLARAVAISLETQSPGQ